MSVLVTGGAGYIGSHMVWALLDAGHNVIVVDNLSTGFEWAVAPGAKFYPFDINDTVRLKSIVIENNVDTIIHFAASIVVSESVSDPVKYYENNSLNSQKLIQLAIECKINNFIFSSTAAVYGQQDGENPIVETDPLLPNSPYGRSKLATEWMLQDAASVHNLNYAILRYFNVAGADRYLRSGYSSTNATHLIKIASEVALGKRSHINVYGNDYPTHDGTCIRDYIHISDLIDIHIKSYIHLRSGKGNLIANCGYGRGFSVLEILDTVQNVLGQKIDIRKAERRPGDIANIVANTTKIKDLINWKPLYDDIYGIIKSTLEWEKKLSSMEHLKR